jgi:hypothetical protein
VSLRGFDVRRAVAEQARRPGFARHTGNAAALLVYMGPSTAGHPAWVRLERAFFLRRRVRLALESAETTRRRHKQQRELMKGALAVAALGALALGQRRRAAAHSRSNVTASRSIFSPDGVSSRLPPGASGFAAQV